jgi:hypothetical protein
MEEEVLKVVCAWHSLYFPKEPTPLLDIYPNEPNGTSHGICKPCNTHFLRENGLKVYEEQPQTA